MLRKLKIKIQGGIVLLKFLKTILKNLFFAAAFALTFINSIAGPNEVGGNLFVDNPKTPPLYVSQSGDRYWDCDGMVSPQFIEIVHNDLSFFSGSIGIPKPMRSPCRYSIAQFNVGGASAQIISLNFYVSSDSMNTCKTRNYCDNVRSMNFSVLNNNLHKQYLLTNADKKISRMICVDMNGKIVSTIGCITNQ